MMGKGLKFLTNYLQTNYILPQNRTRQSVVPLQIATEDVHALLKHTKHFHTPAEKSSYPRSKK